MSLPPARRPRRRRRLGGLSRLGMAPATWFSDFLDSAEEIWATEWCADDGPELCHG
ncbi:MAG: hypothetical protein M3Z46_03325 [Actinomycetota bacterium]|nr:hypothetical protein [Actinomycetota bacterium]